MPDIKTIRTALSRHEPALIDTPDPRAAVAAILHGERDPEILLIERARRAGDPWSGQMAFPGGRHDQSDSDLFATAARETREEVGLHLGRAALLGRLNDQSGRRGGRGALVIAAFVFELAERPPELVLSEEVETAHWVPLSALLDPKNRIDYRFPPHPSETFPAIVVGDPDRHVVWGLTHRFLGSFFETLGQKWR